MKHDPIDPKQLLGGYAAGNLTEEERKRLLAAAVADQELFNALAAEEPLREVLNDAPSRQRLLRSLEESPRRPWAWLWRPRTMALAGTLAAAVVMAIVWKQPEHRKAAIQVAQPARRPAEPPAAASQLGAAQDARINRADQDRPVAPPKVAAERLAEARPAFRDAQEVTRSEVAKESGAKKLEAPLAPPPPAAPAAAVPEEARKMRVAVMSFDAQSAALPQTQQVNQAVGEMLNKRLDQSGAYQLVDQRETDRLLQSRQQAGPVDAQTAAQIGRSLGADAVILANVTPVAGESKAPAPGKSNVKDEKAKVDQGTAAAGTRPMARVSGGLVSLSASAIDTRTAARMAVARGRAPMNESVDQVANQIESQLRGTTRRIEGTVTDVNATILTLALDTGGTIRPGDVLEVLRDGRVIGLTVVTAVTSPGAVSTYRGTVTPRIGDQVKVRPDRLKK